MADHLTEEEQIEAIKRWWQNNWLSIVVPVVAAALIYTGWNFYSDYQAKQSAAASDEYQALIDLIQPAGEGLLDADLKAQAAALAADIQSNYAGTLYADLSAMITARIAVQDNNLDAAASALQIVVDSGANDAVVAIAKARLARVLVAQNAYDQALALVAPTDSMAVKALYAEIRGDIYVAKGEVDAARTAYELALESLDPQQYANRGLLQFKLDALLAPAPIASEEVTVVDEGLASQAESQE